MRRLALLLVLLSLSSASYLLADAIPYPTPGVVAPQSLLIASATGDVTGYFVMGGPLSGGGAAYLDFVRLFDVTAGTFSGWLFDNQTSTAGLTADFGHVTAGDTLIFEIQVVNLGNTIFASDSAYSADGSNHGYATGFQRGLLNGAEIPAGLYIGMEDLPALYSDFNYRDDTFVVTGVAPVPEPGSVVLIGTGALLAAASIRRRLFKQSS